jgi:hypothetical protein
VHDETAQGVEAAFILPGQVFLDVEYRLEPFDTHIAIDQPRAVLALEHVALRGLGFGEFADDGRHHVGQGHQALNIAVLVDDQGELQTGAPEVFQQLGGGHRFRNVQRRVQNRLDVRARDAMPGQGLFQQVAGLQHAEDMVEPVAAHDEAGKLGFDDALAGTLVAFFQVDDEHFPARRHDRRNLLLVQAQDVGDDFLLARGRRRLRRLAPSTP